MPRGRPPTNGTAKDSNKIGPKQKAKKLFKQEENFTRSIWKVLKQVHPEIGISKVAMTTMNSIILEFYRTVGKEAQTLNQKAGRRGMNAQDIQSAVKIVVPGELCKHAVAQAATAITKYNLSRQVKN